MERDSVTVERKEGFFILTAEEGFMVTNGTYYGKKAYLSEKEDINNWYETEEVGDEY